MNEVELQELLEDLGLDKIRMRNGRKGINFTFSCPKHTDRKPSAGVVLDGYSVYGGCFSCKWRFTLPQLVAECRGINEWDALQEINERFNLHHRKLRISKFRYYEEEKEENKRFELPYMKLAPFKSGKSTHKYFLDRGFNQATVNKFLIGWDRVKKRITIPIFYQDGVLAGIIERAVLDENDERYAVMYGNEPKYLIYKNFPIGSIFFGEHCFSPIDETVILVEGSFDIMWMHQLGFTNTLSTIIANLTEKQRDFLFKYPIKNVVLFYDNDSAGRKACSVAYELLKPFFRVYTVEYPDNTKDPMDLDKEHIQAMLDNKKFYWKTSLKKL